jgi:hypothetical protein
MTGSADLVAIIVIAFMVAILLMIVVSQLIFYIMKKLHPERGYGKGESCGGIPSIDNIWFE